ncbi:MAG TPA: hypothetical protein ENN55_04390, partial [Firmicutes bacterium]|nr:hypothetical protein [Bacillota bacterium]
MNKGLLFFISVILSVFICISCSSTGMRMESPEFAEQGVEKTLEKAPERPSLPEQKIPESRTLYTQESGQPGAAPVVREPEKTVSKPEPEKAAVKAKTDTEPYKRVTGEKAELKETKPAPAEEKEKTAKKGWVFWFILFIIIGILVLIFLVIFTREKKKDDESGAGMGSSPSSYVPVEKENVGSMQIEPLKPEPLKPEPLKPE